MSQSATSSLKVQRLPLLIRKAQRQFDPFRFAYLSTLLIISLFILWLYRDIDNTFKKVYQSFIANEVVLTAGLAENIEKRIAQTLPANPVERLKKDPNLRRTINDLLALFSTSHFRYVYLLVEKEGRLRYLADGSKELNQRGLFGQRFTPDTKAWTRALASGRPQFSVQKDYTGLWLTYYYPLKIWPKTRALLIFDISLQAYTAFSKLLEPLKKLLKVLSFTLLLLLGATVVWSILFYRQRRKNSIDPLTRLYNRNLLLRIKDHIDLTDTSVLMIDLDHFKRINDRYGHETGDMALIHAARILQRCTRIDDIVIRYGGEEFLVFIVGVSDRKQVIEIARRIHQGFHRQPLKAENRAIPLTASIGVVPVPGATLGVEEAIRLADKMLYIAKTSGRDRVAVYEEESTEPRPLLFNEIEEIIEKGGLFFLYQPIVCAKSKKIVRYEVLARLRGKNHIYTPDEFIPPLQGTLAYRTLSKQLLQHAFSLCRDKGVALSINFDVSDFLDETLFEMIVDEVRRHKDQAKRLTIELLEERTLPDLSLVSQKIDRLRNLGIRIAIDDYGKGYAGLNYLIHFRPDFVKIDRLIITKAVEDPTILGILKTLQSAATQLKIETVAEGVENADMADMVERIGIDYMQGYYFGKPSKSLIGKSEEESEHEK